MVCYEFFLFVYMFTVRQVLSDSEDFQKVIFAKIDLGKDPDKGGIKVQSVTVPNNAVDWDDLDAGGKRGMEELQKFRPTYSSADASSDEGEPFYQSSAFIAVMVVLAWVFGYYGLAMCFCPERLRKRRVVFIRFRGPSALESSTSPPTPV